MKKNINVKLISSQKIGIDQIMKDKEQQSDSSSKKNTTNNQKLEVENNAKKDQINEVTYDEDFKKRIKSLYLDIDNHHEQVEKIYSVYKNSEDKLIPSGRIERKDIKFSTSDKPKKIDKKTYRVIEDLKFTNYLFIRAVATDILFKNVDFSKTIFDNCYLKDCRFENCNFEGAKFANSNLQGSYYRECNFDYVMFEKTFVDFEIFECAPKWDNLRFRFARALKLNYASVGDYIKATKAVKIELQATLSHLRSSWSSGDDFYLKKYGGLEKRFKQFYKWIKVNSLDFIWGNGESLKKLIFFNFYVFFILSVIRVFSSNEKFGFIEFLKSLFVDIPSIYFGLKVDDLVYVNATLLPLTILRLVSIALLMSIIIKRYNRR